MVEIHELLKLASRAGLSVLKATTKATVHPTNGGPEQAPFPGDCPQNRFHPVGQVLPPSPSKPETSRDLPWRLHQEVGNKIPAQCSSPGPPIQLKMRWRTSLPGVHCQNFMHFLRILIRRARNRVSEKLTVFHLVRHRKCLVKTSMPCHSPVELM
ncbi:uncharacterized protein C9orf153 homolog isoform X3 [Panthera leo]|uniref:uncharacterized protein C9orf153 homolog isoform X3 n=1 Tax=Panthera leo TaxID=9689 RepID=UPI001C6A3317|nr:uncharacterized protein C9orf153 homolog isoform X3 [Panthera leo]